MASFFGNRRKSDEVEEQQPAPTTPPRSVQSPRPAPTGSPQPLGFETVLGASSMLEGKLKSDGNIRLDGTFNGTLDISGNVLVGETAKIEADIDAKNISIAGAVRGNVIGNKVQILRTGRVWGDINATALTTEEGAFIDGKIAMKNAPSPFTLAEANAIAEDDKPAPVDETSEETAPEGIAQQEENADDD
jgi:cytoskeletal protein CcmA (bactofilin family)